MLKHPRPPGPRPTSRTPAEVLAFIRQRCVEEGDCWLWDMSVTSTGYPNCKAIGMQSTYAHVSAYIAHHGVPVPKGMKVARTCGDKLCCNPEHMRLASASAVGKRAAKSGAFSTAHRRAKLSAVARANSPLTAEQVEQVRSQLDITGEEWARRLNVSRSTISLIRRGKSWRGVGLGSHWQQLAGASC